MIYFRENLKYLLEKHGLNANSLQEETKDSDVKLGQSTTRRILNGETEHTSPSTVDKYAKFFNIYSLQLQFELIDEDTDIKPYGFDPNEGLSSSEILEKLFKAGGASIVEFSEPNQIDINATTIPPQKKLIPVLNYVQAGLWHGVGDNSYDEYVESYEGGKNNFALKIEGFSMINEYYPNDVIEVNPDIAPIAGDCVVARNTNNECTFKKYRPRGIDEKTKKEWFELVPLNPEFPTLDSRTTPFEVIAVAVTQIKRIRRGIN